MIFRLGEKNCIVKNEKWIIFPKSQYVYSDPVLDKLQKQVCRAVSPSPDACLEPLTHCHNIVSLSHFYRFYFGRCSFELVELAPIPCSRGRSSRYSISSNFLLPFLHVIRMSVSTSTISFWLELDSGILSLKSAFL